MTPDLSAAAAAEELFSLFRAGRLVADYPRVAGLIGALSGDELTRAGRLLARLDPHEVIGAHPGLRSVTVAVTGHGTVASIVPALTGQLARYGIPLRPFTGDYDGYVFELSNPASLLYQANPDVTACLLDPMVVFDEVPDVWRPADVRRVLDGKLRLIEDLVTTFEATSPGLLVLNTVPLPHTFTAQLADHRSRRELSALWREANVRLLRLADSHPSLLVVDLDPLIAEGIPAVEPRLSAYARQHLSSELLSRYARELGHVVRQVTGRVKKCLVLDLDGTVWGGVLGEDGVTGIEYAEGPRGEAFRTFQRVVKQIGSQGVLLAVISKNDQEQVRAALTGAAGMALREDDFVRVIANWRPKHENMAELAAALNVAVDSVVYVDDSPFECGLIRRELPGVAVVAVDEEPALHVERLLRDDWFGMRELTQEDYSRGAKYRAELERQDFLDAFGSLEDYLRELGVEVRLAPVEEKDVARTSQLSLRTNQFNLTTRRLQPADVSRLAVDPDALVLTVRSSDRFGDNGLVGAVFLRSAGNGLHIDNFVLSCRVFSRGIEQACLSAILRLAKSAGHAAVYGSYRPTERNGVVSDFYPRNGFAAAGNDDGTATFRHDLTALIDTPGHLTLHDDLGREIWLAADGRRPAQPVHTPTSER